MHDYKEDYSHGSVAFPHRNLDTSTTCPGAGTEWTPNSPSPFDRCGIVLFGNTQAMFAVLKWKETGQKGVSKQAWDRIG